jgi:glycosyltransferase involved in cell wall biosynthesis
LLLFLQKKKCFLITGVEKDLPKLMTKPKKSITALFLLRRLDCDNGITSYCETIMRGLKKAGDRVVVVTGPITVTPASQQRLDSLMALADEWRVLPKIGQLKLLYQSLKAVLPIIRSQNADVICPQGFKMLPLTKLLSLFSGKPAVVVFHGGAASHVGEEGSLKERMYYTSVTKIFAAAKFISMSSETSEFMTGTCGINPARIVVIPNGVDISHFRPPSAAEQRDARAFFNIRESSLVCVLSGRVSLDKGHHLAVEAVRHLRLSHPEIPIVCLFAGSTGSGVEILEQALQDANDHKAFRFLGFVSGDLLRQAYWAADIVLLPSLIEGFPIAVAEAMACGCVAIRTPAGGCRDQIIEDVTGFVVPFGDSQALADKINLLTDAARLARMRAAARAHVVANFSEEDMIARTVGAYRTTASAI